MTARASAATNRIHTGRKITWTNLADSRLVRLRDEGASIRSLAIAFGLSRTAIAVRAGRLGLALPTKPPVPAIIGPAPDLARDPLPAGHPISWGLITAGTALEGAAYQIPDSQRLRRAPARVAAAEPAEPAA